MALGANRAQITRLVLSRGARIAVAGCLSGVVLSAFASRLLLTSLYRTHWYDPVMFCVVPLVLFTAVLLASWLPARRAAISCMLNRLTLLTAGNEPKLADLFARAELRRGSCAGPNAADGRADWVGSSENPQLRGAL